MSGKKTKESSSSAPRENSDSDINTSYSDSKSVDNKTLKSYQLAREREMRVVKPPKRYAYADFITHALTAAHELSIEEPKTYKEAIENKESDKWKVAIDEEITSL